MKRIHPKVRYLLGATLTLPVLPLLVYQALRVKNSVPDLPEAEGTHGTAGNGTKKINVLLLGESTAAGVGVDNHKDGFAGKFSQQLAEYTQQQVQWLVCARSGFTAKKTRQQLLGDIPDQHYDLVVISLGGNDSFKLSNPWHWENQVILLIRELRGRYPTVPIVFCSMPPISDFPAFTPLMQFVFGNLVKILGEQLGRAVRAYDNTYYHDQVISIDSWEKKLGISEEISHYFSDGVHPSPFTYQTLASDLFEFIEQQPLLKDDFESSPV